MFLDRRALLQSAAALIVPPAAAIPPWGKTENREHAAAVERYFATFTAFYGRPYRPDDNTWDAHHRANSNLQERKEAFESARDELIVLVMEAHGFDRENQDAPMRALTLDIGELTLAVAPHQELDMDPPGAPLGLETLALIPRTAAMRARLDALPTLDPHEWESEEEEERLGIPDDRPPQPAVDLSRMPAGEPVPLAATRYKPTYGPDNGMVEITRKWTPRDAIACKRCIACPFWDETVESLRPNDRGEVGCKITVRDEDVEQVLYGATPPHPGRTYSDSVVIVCDWGSNIGDEPGIIDVMVTTRQDWETGDYDKEDWSMSKGDWGTGGDLVAAIRYMKGPVPCILHYADVKPTQNGSESMA